MSRIRMGLIGCGGMGGAHQSGLAELNDRMELTAVCDILPERAEAARKALGAAKAVTDWRDLTDDVDAVLISLPHHLHYPAGHYFLGQGKHVLMEKPLCNREDECLRLIRESEQAGRILMCAYPVRYWPIIQEMKRLVDQKTYGDVFQMSIWTEQLTYYSERHWAMSADTLGGGQFFSHGCHYVDLLLWFLGKPVRGVHFGTNTGTPWMEREGTSNATIEFDGGVLGYHFGTWGARGTRLGYSFHIHCTEGMLEYDYARQALYLHTEMRQEKADLDVRSNVQVLLEETDATKKTQFETRHFLDCIRDRRPPLTDGPSALQGLRVIWRLYDAERENRVADLSGLGLDEDWRAPAALVRVPVRRC